MLTAIKDFFERNIAGPSNETAEGSKHRAQVAAAALMMEVVLSDARFSDGERQVALAAVQRKFSLDREEARQLVELAESQARQAHDLFQFTSQINATFAPDEKAGLIVELWRAAYADATLHSQEEHAIRRIADLLHVPHARFIAAKLKVLDEQARSRGSDAAEP